MVIFPSSPELLRTVLLLDAFLFVHHETFVTFAAFRVRRVTRNGDGGVERHGARSWTTGHIMTVHRGRWARKSCEKTPLLEKRSFFRYKSSFYLVV